MKPKTSKPKPPKSAGNDSMKRQNDKLAYELQSVRKEKRSLDK